jgi:hypothetical protein
MKKILIFNHHPDCVLYLYKAFKELGYQVDIATEKLAFNLGFSYYSGHSGNFDIAGTSIKPEEFDPIFKNCKMVNDAGSYDKYVSIRPEIYQMFGSNAWFDCQLQAELGYKFDCIKSCNHQSAKHFGYEFCPNWIPYQNPLIEKKYITQIITELNSVKETNELLHFKNNGLPVKIYGGKSCPDGYIRDNEILPYTSLLVHNKKFGINCYAVCKALDRGIPVYMEKFTKSLIGFDDLPDDLFFFREKYTIDEAYRLSLDIDNNKIQNVFRSIYTLDRLTKRIEEILDV